MIAVVCDIILFSRIKRVFENSSTSVYSAKALIWAVVNTAGTLAIGVIRNDVNDWPIINHLGITSRFQRPFVINGSVRGFPGLGGGGGIFRTSRGFTKACFSWWMGICFVFEAKLMSLFFAVEKAYELNWHNIWIETDSTYIVHLFNRGIGKVSGTFHSSWSRAVYRAKKLNIIVLNIFREGNNVANQLASEASSSQCQHWWTMIPENLASTTYRDHIGLPYFIFSYSFAWVMHFLLSLNFSVLVFLEKGFS